MNKIVDLCGKTEGNTNLKYMMNTPYDINGNWPIYIQVCNCNYIGYNANKKWHKIVCTYKFLPGERMWKVQTG